MPVNREIYSYRNSITNLRGLLQPQQRGVSSDGYPSGGIKGLWTWKDDDNKFHIGARQVRWHNGAWERLNNTFGHLDVLNIKTTGLSDDWVTTPVPIGESGATALSGSFDAVSIIGALNELIQGVDPLWSSDGTRVFTDSSQFIDVGIGLGGTNVNGFISVGEEGAEQLSGSFDAVSIIGALNELADGGGDSKWVEVNGVLKPVVEEQVQIGDEEALGIFTAKDGSTESPTGNLIVTNAPGDMHWGSLNGTYEPVDGRPWSYKRQGFSVWINQGEGTYSSVWVITTNENSRNYWDGNVSHYSLYGATGVWLKTFSGDVREPVTEWSTGSVDYRPSFFGYGDIVSTSLLRGGSLEVGGALVVETDEFEDIHFKRLNNTVFSILENSLTIQQNHLQVGGNVSEWVDSETIKGFQADEMNIFMDNNFDAMFICYNCYPVGTSPISAAADQFKTIANGKRAFVKVIGQTYSSLYRTDSTHPSETDINGLGHNDTWTRQFILSGSGASFLNALDTNAINLGATALSTANNGTIRFADGDIYGRIGGEWVSLTSSGDIPDGSITTAKLADGAVTTDKLADKSVDVNKLVDMTALSVLGRVSDTGGPVGNISAGDDHSVLRRSGNQIAFGLLVGESLTNLTVTGGKIANDAITSAKLANDAVITDKIADDAVTTSKIINTAVTTNKLALGSVTETRIADNAVTNSKLATAAVDTANLQGASVDSDKLATDSVTTAKIVDGAVLSAKIGDGAVSFAKMANINGQRLLGKPSVGSGLVSEISLGDGLVFDGTTLIATGGGGSSYLSASKSWDTGDFSGNTLKTTTITVTGASIGDPVAVSVQGLNAAAGTAGVRLWLFAEVTSSNTVTVYATTSGYIAGTTRTVKVTVFPS